MRFFATLLVVLFSLQLKAQTDDGIRTAKMLPLDTTISGAKSFNDQLLTCASGYTFKFVDKESPNELKYLYEHSSHETLKIEYTYRQRATDSSGKLKPIIFTQKIIADNTTMALIYNCMFSESINGDQLEAFSGVSRGFVFRDKDYHYSLLPDDYKPGYWVLMFTE